jgi:hypothetical protein
MGRFEDARSRRTKTVKVDTTCWQSPIEAIVLHAVVRKNNRVAVSSGIMVTDKPTDVDPH